MYRTKSQLIGNVSTGASFAGIITAPGLSVDTVNISGVSTVANVRFSSGIITATSGVVTYYGDGSGLTGISAGSTVFDDTSTNAIFYPVFIGSTSGLISTSRVSTTKLTFNPSTSTLQVGTGITLSGSTGSISIAGTIFASSLDIPIQVSSFNPAIGSTQAGLSTNIVLNFNQTVGFGTTGFFEIKTGLGTTGGTLVERVGIGSTRVVLDNGGRRLTIDPTSNFGLSSSFYVTMSSGFVVANGNNFTGINTVGTSQTYYFRSEDTRGSSFGGGNLICQASGVRWIVAPLSAEVSRDWYCRADANTRAQAVSGCTGWFVPIATQLQNPGFVCRQYWESFSDPAFYYGNNEYNPSAGCGMHSFGVADISNKTYARCVRSFRCVTY